MITPIDTEICRQSTNDDGNIFFFENTLSVIGRKICSFLSFSVTCVHFIVLHLQCYGYFYCQYQNRSTIFPLFKVLTSFSTSSIIAFIFQSFYSLLFLWKCSNLYSYVHSTFCYIMNIVYAKHILIFTINLTLSS